MEALKQKFNLLRVNAELLVNVKYVIFQLEDACKNKEFGSLILQNSLFLQLMVHLNRVFFGMERNKKSEDVQYDENIGGILTYIKENLQKTMNE